VIEHGPASGARWLMALVAGLFLISVAFTF
jgi:hypothetical protein